MEADVPEYLVDKGRGSTATEADQAVRDLALIAFYYLLCIGEYTIKGQREETKQTVQFKMEDITFFWNNTVGQLRCLPRMAPDAMILSANGATMRLDNQKNGWKGVCVYQEHNGSHWHCPARVLGRRYLHLRQHRGTTRMFLSADWEGDIRHDMTAENMSRALKGAAAALEYSTVKGIPIQRINTHSLRSGGANALALAGYSDTQIQKMGRWKGATFKEYIRGELACFSMGMSTDMKRKFNFVNIAGNAFYDVTDSILTADEAQGTTGKGNRVGDSASWCPLDTRVHQGTSSGVRSLPPL